MATQDNSNQEQSSQEEMEKETHTQQTNRKSVMHYLVILFAAAFCLMLLTYLMERRTNETELNFISGYMDVIIDDKGTVEEQRNSLISALATAEADITHQAEEFSKMEAHYQEEIEALQTQLEEAQATIQQLEEALSHEDSPAE